MSPITQAMIDQIVKECLQSFQSLPKTGKPLNCEWTVLTCIIQRNTESGKYRVVSIGTGSKCIGATKMCPAGYILNDSHAEVMARRGFLLYLYQNIELCLDNKNSIFQLVDSKCKLKENIEFIFYCSQLPCGDASIVCKDEVSDEIGDIIPSMKRSIQDTGNECEEKRSRLDIHRTGAKCLQDSIQDLKLPGAEYHILGQVRTKPGRGDRTLSVSCSDKIARWIHLGIQGSLISLLMDEPIVLNHYIFGNGVPYSVDSLKRALCMRNLKIIESISNVHFYQSTITFPYIKTEECLRPAPCSIVYIDIHSGTSEVAVQGKKLGVTKKQKQSLCIYLCICKYNLYKRFQEILVKNKTWCEEICGSTSLQNICYNEMKQKSVKYNNKWKEIKHSFFQRWTVKPDIFAFKVS
ncbi:unnamed protein product [Leptosia nina]|uniref:tRNA-specific adenosine deaminase 1 n=1 Tax=Leptosia nina TaxID=320188 RepID=A0AAV1J9I9_9NEOP